MARTKGSESLQAYKPTSYLKHLEPCLARLAAKAMDFLPKVDEQAMLEAVGASSVEALFEDLPPSVRCGIEGLPPGAGEQEVEREVSQLLAANRTAGAGPFFLGRSTYRHHIPAAVAALVFRSEFYTAYTPYQAEASQGTLQAGFEFASAMVELTGMEVAAQPVYDGATALAEAVRMAAGARRGDRFLVPANLSRFQKGVLANYTTGLGLELVEVGWDNATGGVDWGAFEAAMTSETVGAYFELPNGFGVVDPQLLQAKELLGQALLVVGVNPLALALYSPPGEWGADIVVGDVQPLGNPMSLGGPSAGFVATTRKLMRRLPGRLVGLTKDCKGRRAYCLTLQTREQHIRRARATSNICTNEALNGLAAIIYLALKGRTGLREVAAECALKARATADRLAAIEGVEVPLFSGVYFNEFVVGLDRSSREVAGRLARRGLNGGLPLDAEGLDHGLLVAATECTTALDIESLAQALEGVLGQAGPTREAPS